MSITQQRGKDHKTNPKKSEGIFSLLLNVTEHCHTKLRTAMHDCTGSISLTGEFICRLNDNHVFPRISILKLPIQFSHKFFLKFTISPSQTDHPNQIILNCWFCSAGQSTQFRQPRQPHGKENLKKAIWNFLCCLGLLGSKGLHFNGSTCVKRKRGTVWKHCVRVKKVECCSQAVTPTTNPQLK